MNAGLHVSKWLAASAVETLQSTPETEDRARQCLLDWLGVLIAARPAAPRMGLPPIAQQNSAAYEYVTMKPVAAHDAAFTNASAAHLMDFDDCHNDVPGHASVTVIAAALATAEAASGTLEDVFKGAIAGVEVAAQLGRMCGPQQYKRGWHPTATLGSMAAAAASAVAGGLDEQQMSESISLGALQSSGAISSFGSIGKSWQVGCAARNGVYAASAISAGYDCPHDYVGGSGGVLSLMSDWQEPNQDMEGPNRIPRIMDTVFKYYATCFGTHAAIACAEEIANDRAAIDPSDIVGLNIELGPQFSTLVSNPQPQSGLEAKFSVSSVVAMTLAGAPPTVPDFFSHPVVSTDLYRRIEHLAKVTNEPSMHGGAARVTIQLKNAGPRTVERQEATPVPTDVEWGPLIRKFVGVTGPLIGDAATNYLVHLIRHGEQAEPAFGVHEFESIHAHASNTDTELNK